MIKIITPITKNVIISLKAGDVVSISGVIYTARDATHKKMIETLNRGEELPFEIKDQIIYYAGPCPAKPGKVIGLAGPTTSGRMDAYTPRLLQLGLGGMIGKGARSKEVIDSIVGNKSIYFGATGGAGALIAGCITGQEIIAYPELGPEALRRLEVVNFPATVIIDSQGYNLYEMGKAKYKME